MHGFHIPGTLVPYGAAAEIQAQAARLAAATYVPPVTPPRDLAAEAAQALSAFRRRDAGNRIARLAEVLIEADISPQRDGIDLYYPLGEFDFFYQERSDGRPVGLVHRRLLLGFRLDGRPIVLGMNPQPDSWDTSSDVHPPPLAHPAQRLTRFFVRRG